MYFKYKCDIKLLNLKSYMLNVNELFAYFFFNLNNYFYKDKLALYYNKYNNFKDIKILFINRAFRKFNKFLSCFKAFKVNVKNKKGVKKIHQKSLISHH